MGIKFRCRACDKKLHVKSFLAGKRGICPHCGEKVDIPRESQAAAQPVAVANNVNHHAAGPPARKNDAAARKPKSRSAPLRKEPASSRVAASTMGQQTPAVGTATTAAGADDPLTSAPDAVWYVRPPSGGQFGPANADIMQRWLEEGRVSADSLVWREGWPDWKTAGPVFPALNSDPVADVDSEAPLHARISPEFPVSGERNLGVATRMKNRPRRGGQRRNVVMIVVLSVACVALLIALFVVLTNQG